MVITPEYNHSFPAPLKNAIDWYGAEWANKPVAFVSYGGVSGGLRAVQQLRHVFIELRATPIRDTVSFHDIWSLFDTDGTWPKPSEQREQAVATLLDQLVWSATTLRAGRGGVEQQAKPLALVIDDHVEPFLERRGGIAAIQREVFPPSSRDDSTEVDGVLAFGGALILVPPFLCQITRKFESAAPESLPGSE